jgi:hypothetical protein
MEKKYCEKHRIRNTASAWTQQEKNYHDTYCAQEDEPSLVIRQDQEKLQHGRKDMQLPENHKSTYTFHREKDKQITVKNY